jgi:hypothetical protein
MSETKVREFYVYRSGIDTPIVLYDKSNIDDKTIVNMVSNVFSSPKISILKTSSSTLIIKPSKIDSIEIINSKIENDMVDALPVNDIEENSESVIEKVTTEIDIPMEEIEVEEIDIPANLLPDNED